MCKVVVMSAHQVGIVKQDHACAAVMISLLWLSCGVLTPPSFPLTAPTFVRLAASPVAIFTVSLCNNGDVEAASFVTFTCLQRYS